MASILSFVVMDLQLIEFSFLILGIAIWVYLVLSVEMQNFFFHFWGLFWQLFKVERTKRGAANFKKWAKMISNLWRKIMEELETYFSVFQPFPITETELTKLVINRFITSLVCHLGRFLKYNHPEIPDLLIHSFSLFFFWKNNKFLTKI